MKAEIRVTRKVVYHSIVEMKEEVFAAFNRCLDGTPQERKGAEKRLNDLIDTADWQDDELDCLESFERHAGETQPAP